jgi:Neuraminidase (sialidase)
MQTGEKNRSRRISNIYGWHAHFQGDTIFTGKSIYVNTSFAALVVTYNFLNLGNKENAQKGERTQHESCQLAGEVSQPDMSRSKAEAL